MKTPSGFIGFHEQKCCLRRHFGWGRPNTEYPSFISIFFVMANCIDQRRTDELTLTLPPKAFPRPAKNQKAYSISWETHWWDSVAIGCSAKLQHNCCIVLTHLRRRVCFSSVCLNPAVPGVVTGCLVKETLKAGSSLRGDGYILLRMKKPAPQQNNTPIISSTLSDKHSTRKCLCLMTVWICCKYDLPHRAMTSCTQQKNCLLMDFCHAETCSSIMSVCRCADTKHILLV